MKKLDTLFGRLFLAAMLSAGSPINSISQTVFISEIHYDNTGADVNEAVEIFAPAGTDLSCYSIVLYNGASPFTSYFTQALSGTVDDEGCGFGAVSFSISGIQNGSPDGLALYNTCSSTLIQFLSYEGTFTASGGVANGVLSTSIGVSETGSEPIGQSLQLTGSGTTYGSFSWNSPSASSAGSINSGMDPCGCSGPVAQPTTETTADSATPSCLSATINWTASTTADNVIVVVSTGAIASTPTDGVAYTASATFGSGETIGAGQFVVYNGSGTSVIVTGLSLNTTYNYAIFGYDGVAADCEENYLTGGNFGSFSTLASCQTAQITSLMINSCNGTAEGTDELIIIENGDELININDMVIDLPNTTWCNAGCGGNTIVNNATYVADLNAMAGCSPDLFVYADPIPAGATIIIFTGDPPSTVLDYSANCGAPGAPMYVLFLNNSSITGNFANSGTAIKTIDIDFGNGQSDVVSYLPDDVDPNDGGSVNYDAAGNPTYYTSTDCVYPLSVRLLSISAKLSNDQIHLNWSTSSESEPNHHIVERSIDGTNFSTISVGPLVPAADYPREYVCVDSELPLADHVYYRIAFQNVQGEMNYSPVVQVQLSSLYIYYSNGMIYVKTKEDSFTQLHLNIYSLEGQLLHTSSFKEDTALPFGFKGVFLIEIPELNYRTKIACF